MHLAEETDAKPKPMIEVGGMPLLWQIMSLYAAHGFDDFIVCVGYKAYVVKEYFTNLVLHSSTLWWISRSTRASISAPTAFLADEPEWPFNEGAVRPR